MSWDFDNCCRTMSGLTLIEKQNLLRLLEAQIHSENNYGGNTPIVDPTHVFEEEEVDDEEELDFIDMPVYQEIESGIAALQLEYDELCEVLKEDKYITVKVAATAEPEFGDVSTLLDEFLNNPNEVNIVNCEYFMICGNVTSTNDRLSEVVANYLEDTDLGEDLVLEDEKDFFPDIVAKLTQFGYKMETFLKRYASIVNENEHTFSEIG